jgi:cytidylate kinase-like protein
VAVHPPSIDQILERQARLQAMRDRAAAQGGDAARGALAHREEGPWIAVSKQAGTDGHAIAQRVAGDLGWQAYDREILTAIAQHTERRESVLARFDEREIGTLDDYLGQLVVPGNPGRYVYWRELVRTVWALGRGGNAVLVGRGAHWVLRRECGLAVRLVAPRAYRAALLARRTGVGEADASRQLERDDRTQARFVRQVFGRAIDDAEGYDLVLNVATLGADAAACTIEDALHRKLG